MSRCNWSPQRHQRKRFDTNTEQKKRAEQRKRSWCIRCIKHEADGHTDLWLSVCVCAYMMFVSHVTFDYLHVCMHAAAVHTFEFPCVHMWHLPLHPEPSHMFLYMCCSVCRVQPISSLWRSIQVLSAWSFCLWLNSSHLVNSHHATLFLSANNCGNKLEQSVTANESESQEAEPRARVEQRAEGVYSVVMEIICAFTTASHEKHEKYKHSAQFHSTV